MKKTHTRTIFRKIILGTFLGIFLFSGEAVLAEERECDDFKDNAVDILECEKRYDCRWHEEWKDKDGQIHLAKCSVRSEVCRSVNHNKALEDAEKKTQCVAHGCWWKGDLKTGVCRPKEGTCEGRRWSGCLLDSDCRWFEGACMLRAAKQDEKAVGALDGICIPDGTGSRNDFWIEDIIVPCIQPVTNQGVKIFCESNVDFLTPYGKRKCRNGIAHVIKAGEKECLDRSEMTFQKGLKDAAAREQRRSDDAMCRANTGFIYDGPVFEGGGLRSGAILAHENLTKSISHSMDLKELIVNWTRFILEMVAVIAVLAVVWSGILYITDMGDGGNIEKAKKILMWVAIGIFVILGSYAIVNTIMTADFSSAQVINTSFHV